MGLIDNLLEPTGVKYEDLNPSEQETLNSMIDVLQKSKLTVEKVRDFIIRMKSAVEQELSKEPTFLRIFIFKVENPQIIRLQARLRNYLLLEAFLGTPEAAKQQLEDAIAGLAPKRT